MKRERLKSRLGFIMLSAGCAIGLGNVWRFPFVVGENGGGAFVVIYLFFLLFVCAPIMVMEFAVGRASQKSIAKSFDVLQKPKQHWSKLKFMGIIGNYFLMFFYTTIAGWMLAYVFFNINGSLVGLNAAEIGSFFGSFTSDPLGLFLWMVLAVILGFGVCALGLQKGVEKIVKFMMTGLLVLLIFLVVYCLTLPNAIEGLKFYLVPNFSEMAEAGAINVIFNAMGQAFFTLSIGIGSMAIFGSYISKERRLTGETLNVVGLDTLVALMAGLIIFPACASFNVAANSGPGLVFVTLPNVFNNMPAGRIIGLLFFLFMSFAAMSTVIAVFENLVSFGMDLFNFPRKKSVLINLGVVVLLSIPCVLGFNLWSNFAPFGEGSVVLDLLDFIVSNNLLVLGALGYLLFCTSKKGWGYENFLKETNSGKGIMFPKILYGYLKFVLPVLIIVIFVLGYLSKFGVIG